MDITEGSIKWGPIGEDVYRRTYSRKMEDGTYETWPDTVARVVAGSKGSPVFRVAASLVMASDSARAIEV